MMIKGVCEARCAGVVESKLPAYLGSKGKINGQDLQFSIVVGVVATFQAIVRSAYVSRRCAARLR